MRTIGGFLGGSPWGPLYEHMVKVAECAELLDPLVRALCTGREEELKTAAEEIFEREREADAIKNHIRTRLSRSFFSAIDRSDALVVLREQDPIADGCESVARILVSRKTRVAEALVEPITEISEKVVATVLKGREVLARLRDLAESEPSGDEISSFQRLVEEVHECEREVEGNLLGLTKAIFLHEEDMDLLSVWLLVQVSEGMALVSHHAENAVEALQRLSLGRI